MEIERESLAASRHRYATVDADIRMERMMTEIVVGGTKATSLVVDGPADERIWDDLAASIATIPKGATMIYGWPCWED